MVIYVINFVDYSLNQRASARHESTETPIGNESDINNRIGVFNRKVSRFVNSFWSLNKIFKQCEEHRQAIRSQEGQQHLLHRIKLIQSFNGKVHQVLHLKKHEDQAHH